MSSIILREGQRVRLAEIISPRISLRSAIREVSCKSNRLKTTLRLRQNPISVQFEDGSVNLYISGIAGSLLLFGRQIEIMPKFCGDESWHGNIMIMLSRAYGVRFDLQESLGSAQHKIRFVDHIALAFSRSLEIAISDGPIEIYRDVDHSALVAKGRIDIRKTVAGAIRRPGHIHSQASELNSDNPYNRVLHAAADTLLRLASNPQIRNDLRRVRDALPMLPEGSTPPERWPDQPPLQFAAYREALEIAAAVLAGRDWGIGSACSTAFGYVVAMERLFEVFVESSLRVSTSLLPLSLQVDSRRQVSTRFAEPLSFGRRAYYTKPDNVVYLGGIPSIIVDAKYKRFSDADTGDARRPSNSDIYQMFASMAAQGCHLAVLLYPTSAEFDGQLPTWKMSIGQHDAFVIAACLPIAQLRSSEDLSRLDRLLAETCTNALALRQGSSARIMDVA